MLQHWFVSCKNTPYKCKMFIIGGKVRGIQGLSVLFSLFFCTAESIVKRQSLFPGEKSRFLRPAQKDTYVRALKQTTDDSDFSGP